MTDVILLYIFTRLDALQGAFILFMALTGIAAVLCFIWRSMARDEKRVEDSMRWAGRGKKFATFFVVFVVLLVAVPTQRDTAIIVGGKIALDAGRTDTAKEIGQEVLDAVRATLRHAAGK